MKAKMDKYYLVSFVSFYGKAEIDEGKKNGFSITKF